MRKLSPPSVGDAVSFLDAWRTLEEQELSARSTEVERQRLTISAEFQQVHRLQTRPAQQLVRCLDTHLHSLACLVRLPNGVFAPYMSIPTNPLFFDRSGPTKTIWYYEQPLPEGRKNYTKTKPLTYEESADCLKWWPKRKENDRAWKVSAADVLKYDADGNLVSCNLDIKNPSSAEALEHLPPEQLVEDILAKEQRIAKIMDEIKGVLPAPVSNVEPSPR